MRKITSILSNANDLAILKASKNVGTLDNRAVVNLQTADHGGRLFFENAIVNSSQPASVTLRPFGDPVPVIIIGAGPSLLRYVDKIALVQDRAYIIAVDSVLPLLYTRNIRPDVIVTIDAIDTKARRIADYQATLSEPFPLLVHTNQSHPAIPANYPGTSVCIQQDNVIADYFRSRGIQYPITGECLSVVNAALLIAGKLNASPVILAGVDLAFPVDLSATHALPGLWDSPEQPFDISACSEFTFTVRAWDGKSAVPTFANLLAFRTSVEQFIGENPGLYVNVSETGAWIEGCQHVAFDTAQSIYIRSRIAKRPLFITTSDQPRDGRILEELEQNIMELSSIIRELLPALSRKKLSKRSASRAEHLVRMMTDYNQIIEVISSMTPALAVEQVLREEKGIPAKESLLEYVRDLHELVEDALLIVKKIRANAE